MEGRKNGRGMREPACNTGDWCMHKRTVRAVFGIVVVLFVFCVGYKLGKYHGWNYGYGYKAGYYDYGMHPMMYRLYNKKMPAELPAAQPKEIAPQLPVTSTKK